jgi:glucose/mannose-6-phosphate isomerase
MKNIFDNLDRIQKTDTQDMLGRINNLPTQLSSAWEIAQKPLLPDWQGIQLIVIAGMGGSAIGGDLAAAYLASKSEIPVFVHRDYDLPAFANGQTTLVICSSHSGNTEETLSAFKAAQVNDCQIIAVCTGGKLANAARQNKIPLFQFDDDFQPRAAVGFSFGILLGIISRFGLTPDPSSEIANTISAMQTQQKQLQPEVPISQNKAKLITGQIIDRHINVFGADFLAPVARRWKTQINENAKAFATFEVLPEADHNTHQGIVVPHILTSTVINLFLYSQHNHPNNQQRIKLTREAMMLEGINAERIKAKGTSLLSDMWTLLHLGDYISFYLAMHYGIDPTPVPMLKELKEKMKTQNKNSS